MSKGIPVIGRDPNGKAKIVNVDEHGNLKVAQSGNIVEVTTIMNAHSIPAQSTLVSDMFLTGREEEVWVLVNTDRQPWSLQTNAGNGTEAIISSAISPIYPQRTNHTTVYTSVNAPSTHLFYGLRLNSTGTVAAEPQTLEEAKKLIIPIPKGIVQFTNNSTETATVTVRILRRCRS